MSTTGSGQENQEQGQGIAPPPLAAAVQPPLAAAVQPAPAAENLGNTWQADAMFKTFWVYGKVEFFITKTRHVHHIKKYRLTYHMIKRGYIIIDTKEQKQAGSSIYSMRNSIADSLDILRRAAPVPQKQIVFWNGEYIVVDDPLLQRPLLPSSSTSPMVMLNDIDNLVQEPDSDHTPPILQLETKTYHAVSSVVTSEHEVEIQYVETTATTENVQPFNLDPLEEGERQRVSDVSDEEESEEDEDESEEEAKEDSGEESGDDSGDDPGNDGNEERKDDGGEEEERDVDGDSDDEDEGEDREIAELVRMMQALHLTPKIDGAQMKYDKENDRALVANLMQQANRAKYLINKRHEFMEEMRKLGPLDQERAEEVWMQTQDIEEPAFEIISRALYLTKEKLVFTSKFSQEWIDAAVRHFNIYGVPIVDESQLEKRQLLAEQQLAEQ